MTVLPIDLPQFNRNSPAAVRLPIAIVLVSIVTIPTLLFYFSLATSLALGSSVTAIFVTIAALLAPNRLRSPILRSLAFVGIVALAIGLHLAVAGMLHPTDAWHAAASLLPLTVIIVGGTVLANAMKATSDQRFDRAVRIVLAVMGLFVIAKLLGLRVPASREFSNPIFPFTEPSHFVLLLVPFYMYACVAATSRRRLAILALGLVLIVSLESLTLAIGWMLVVLVCSRGWLVPAGVAGLSAIVLTQVDLAYFLDRLDFSDETTNLSTLVYLQGWELVDEALRTTQGWGLGFQQLGLQGTNSEISRVIYLILGADGNILDGGFGLAKLVGEFGVIGIVLAAGVVTLGVQSLLRLRQAARQPRGASRSTIFAHAVLASYLVEFLVRGTGYFSATAILLVAALLLRFGPGKASGFSITGANVAI
ncbi:hypothetical protein GCM10011529_15160 [Polymorphobacter glacialis]|uniref:Uncharacterized protein n=1 Tax=Sandarakinorhabdus glacialis TaxID=1614636 RepID=A0A916ZQY1_9SPHN|nr:hypothetical protein [Polymorphobacter glacialis]GGE09809.1 hypothetical protein GCM10011529_15160 [Polymorphobacter glacialis]